MQRCSRVSRHPLVHEKAVQLPKHDVLVNTTWRRAGDLLVVGRRAHGGQRKTAEYGHRDAPRSHPSLQRDLRHTATILETYSSLLRNKKSCAAVLQDITPRRIQGHRISHVSTPGINMVYLRDLPQGIRAGRRRIACSSCIHEVTRRGLETRTLAKYGHGQQPTTFRHVSSSGSPYRNRVHVGK